MYQLIAQTEQFIVISKDPGISVHRDKSEVGLVMQLERDLAQKLWLVHRLDRITSGLMLLATSAEACNQLAELFRQRRVEKYYIALSDRKPNKKQGRVIGDMVKGRRGGWRLARTRENPAVTEFYSRSAGEGLRLLLCRPSTGQTHQIRVALKSVGAPIIGDPLYHERVDPAPDRGYLHAWQLSFELAGHAYRFVAEPDRGWLFQLDSVREALAAWEPSTLRWHEAGSRDTPAV
ncbi:TIGR01621 family pseudouridine synthase [Marinobacterium sp. D7]|uniref:TIGR01621 family pseudouridine synthase n=1 Tax=Marinobacterium ramblicola TaxID=2849041 RepID=UPI001C2D6F95|nr:TIGR01621 family pseudouridine synthase [Marinobacterium ramblicola]MBV1787549.1 TIGR01621 family pseudouridine synthase [Marinobacterium ramblicola]